MIKTLTAYTAEVDDVEAALDELSAQLDLEHNLLQNTVGILSCYSEFVTTGVVAAMSERFPFDILGTTTLGTAAPDEEGQLLLTLTVLTSDDVHFSAAFCPTLLEGRRKALPETYKQAAAALPEPPKMMIAFMQLMQTFSGDQLIGELDQITGGVPIFGTVTVDHNPDYAEAQVLYKGQGYRDGFAFVLIGGAVDPAFTVVSISMERVARQRAIITASEGNVLQSVNGMPLLAYMQSLGLAKSGQIEGLNSIPFVVDYNDGTTPVARAIFAITPEGYAVCGGVMPVNATLAVGSIDHNDVVETTTRMVKDLLAGPRQDGLLMYSCIARNIALGVDIDAEMQAVVELAKDKIPYQFTYSGGEFCPVCDGQGRLHNRFHNDTVVSCVF